MCPLFSTLFRVHKCFFSRICSSHSLLQFIMIYFKQYVEMLKGCVFGMAVCVCSYVELIDNY